jgi:hypothetical protein
VDGNTAEEAPESMAGFGGKQAWLAIRSGDVELTTAVLGLHDLGTLPWRTGIDLAYFTDDRVVMTPPLAGAGERPWLLVVGRWLARPDSTVDIEDLSELLDTEVQFFATDRVAERHRWARARSGSMQRRFDYVGQDGEVIDWFGEPDAAELAAGLPPSLDGDPTLLVGEGDVLRIAGAWSLDPTTLDGLPAPGPLRAAAAQ